LPHQYLRSALAVVVDPTRQLEGIYRLLGFVGDRETGDTVVVVSLARLKARAPAQVSAMLGNFQERYCGKGPL